MLVRAGMATLDVRAGDPGPRRVCRACGVHGNSVSRHPVLLHKVLYCKLCFSAGGEFTDDHEGVPVRAIVGCSCHVLEETPDAPHGSISAECGRLLMYTQFQRGLC